MPTTYTLDRVTDLLQVPSERRADCMREILLMLELTEFAGAEPCGAILWTDDGQRTCTLADPVGATVLTLEVSACEQS